MKAGDYIFARHPEFGAENYPTVAIKVTKKYLWYTDDEGRKVKIAKSKARLQIEN
jgi:hypothetical protein